ncbi:MAG TPA: AAA family ATPase, partial [Thermoleophilaceae bacterium]|nr:AAA family ATPase [Thermoleophilaceae bacterium]
QRLNIAIGLLAEPPVLLLDEPSASLDPRQRDRLWEFVTELSEGGTTIVYSTHNVGEAERYAGQVVVLADGERLFAGSPGELERAVGQSGLGFESAFVSFLHERGH